MEMRLIGSALCCGRQVQYYLTSEITQDGTENYGVLVKYDRESCVIPGITPSLQKIQELLDALIQGIVTPCTVRDGVMDWLAQA